MGVTQLRSEHRAQAQLRLEEAAERLREVLELRGFKTGLLTPGILQEDAAYVMGLEGDGLENT